MPISIKREETVRLARALKQQTGRPMARVIHEALEESLRRLSQAGPDPERRLAEMRAISRRVARLPDRDTRSAEEIIGYDENGLPS
ncbi:MAG: type II toxin-antitoxin system VapB family antitoxin [Roseiarcus sp.]|jgi:antitoxin VapB|uniref:type II toxin-antitoxin system VapB family antitoxin n=1 Tax=Roseiarcus sp. TaxID=1969460 RepID=UPI003C693B8F